MAEVSTSTIKHIESGRRTLTLRVAQRLAPLLGVTNLRDIYGDSVVLDLDARPSHPEVPAVRRALTAWEISTDGRAEDSAYLRGRIDTAWQVWHTSPQQRTEAGRLLPRLLEQVQRSARLVTDQTERRRVLALEAQAYHLAQAYLAWHGERELVYLTVDRGMAAALGSDDPLAIASSSWYAAHLLRAVGRSDEALDRIRDARQLVEREIPEEPSDDWAAMLADLWLGSALTRARAGDQGAWADWEQAERVASDRLAADYAHPWTRVGPRLVEVYGVMVAVELGDPDEARRIADRIDPATIPSTDRRARHLVELARGAAQDGSREGTLHLLQQAASVSPETVAYTPAGRDLAERVLRESGATQRAAARDLAQRLGIEP